MMRAAGVMFLHGGPRDGRVLLLRYAGGPDQGVWTIPGGGCEGDEEAEACAQREAIEETGFPSASAAITFAPLELHARRQADGVDFTTFLCRVSEAFTPVLSDEHDAYSWQSVYEDGGPMRGGGAAIEQPDGAIAGAGPVSEQLPPPRADAVANPMEIKEKLANAQGAEPPEGVTVRQVLYHQGGHEAGEYVAREKAIVLARRIKLAGDESRLLAQPEKIAAHEIGHAEDHRLGWPSHEFDPAWLAKLLDALEPDERLGAAYYLDAPEEALAEAHALLRGPDDALYFGTMNRLRALAALDPLIDRVRSILLPHSRAAG